MGGNRSAFTLVEMLVVVAIMVAIMGLVAAVGPRFGERQRPSRGAMQLQSWINLAKQRALRDQKPRGIRLPAVPSRDVGTDSYSYVTEVQFIEQPEVFTGGTLYIPFDNSMTVDRYASVCLTGVELPTTGNAAVNPNGFSQSSVGVLFGDILKVDEPPSPPRRILQVIPSSSDPRFPGQIVYTLVLDAEIGGPYLPAGAPVYPTTPPPPTQAYRIFRAARPIPGEPVLSLPKDVGIDISRQKVAVGAIPNWYRLFPATANSGGSGPFDILFDPSGRVVGYETTLGNRICLWVRDITRDFTFNQLPDGDNTLVTIYTRTGAVSAHPVASRDGDTGTNLLQLNTATDRTRWNPFKLTQDGRSSGGQ